MTKQLEEAPVDFSELTALPRPIQADTFAPEAPVTDRSFFDAARLEAVHVYDDYLSTEKGLLLDEKAEVLLPFHEKLSVSMSPLHQTAAGWAAIELAAMSPKMATTQRLSLFDRGVLNWSYATRLYEEHKSAGVRETTNASNEQRLRMNVAIAPLIRSVIEGTCTPEVRRSVFLDCVDVAQENIALSLRAKADNRIEDLLDYFGFTVENIVMLGYNFGFSNQRFAIPSSLRAGDGRYAREDTHDLSLVENFDTVLRRATPTEVKGKVRQHHVDRYRALLIGGIRDLRMPARSTPQVIEALGLAIVNRANGAQAETVRRIAKTIHHMNSDYRNWHRTSPQGSVTEFHRQARPTPQQTA